MKINQAKLAKELNLSTSFVNEVLLKKKRCPAKRAEAFSVACKKLFDVDVPAQEWTFNVESNHPIFKGAESEGVKNEPQDR